jgi:hypothetical protein
VRLEEQSLYCRIKLSYKEVKILEEQHFSQRIAMPSLYEPLTTKKYKTYDTS